MAIAACSGWEGPLVADLRVKILEPKPGSTVTNPVTIRWSSKFEPGAAAGLWFVVYVDFAPGAPNQSMLSAAGSACTTVPECLERGALNGPNIFLTDQHSVDAGTLPPGAGPEHRFTIVLVNEQGVRQGQVAWNGSIRVES
jgi:hypothetical protein